MGFRVTNCTGSLSWVVAREQAKLFIFLFRVDFIKRGEKQENDWEKKIMNEKQSAEEKKRENVKDCGSEKK